MSRLGTIQTTTLSGSGTPELGGVISAIGTPGFADAFLGFLNRACGTQYFTIFRFDGATPKAVLSASLAGHKPGKQQRRRYIELGYWREDPTIDEVHRRVAAEQISLIRLNVDRLPTSDFRNQIFAEADVRERVMICGGVPQTQFGLSILRCGDRGGFEESEIERVGNIASTLFSAAAKHENITKDRPDLGPSLTSLEEIEACVLAGAEKLPRREAEVCARILYGLTTSGMALDLGIGEQTAITYRKRLYQRLNISSQRELLLWYVDLWRRHNPQ